MTVNNCTQPDNWIQSTTVHNLTTEYSQQLYTTEQVKTVVNETQLDTWIQSTTAHNWTTEYSQQLDNWLKSTTGQLNTVNSCTQLDSWMQWTAIHKWSTEYSQHSNWTTEYSPQLNLTGQLKTVNNCTQVNNWIQSIIVHSLKTEHSWLVAPRSLFWTSTISTNYCKCVANFLLNRLFKQTLAFLPWYTAWFLEQGLRHWRTNRLNQKFSTRMNWLLGSSWC